MKNKLNLNTQTHDDSNKVNKYKTYKSLIKKKERHINHVKNCSNKKAMKSKIVAEANIVLGFIIIIT